MILNNLLNKKTIAVIVILFVIITGLFFINNQNNSNPPKINESNNQKNQSGIFIPPVNPGRVTDLSGKIRNIPNIKEDDKVKHVLEDENGKIIVYLSSDDINLDLSLGMDVVISGKIIKDKELKRNVVIIEELKLK